MSKLIILRPIFNKLKKIELKRISVSKLRREYLFIVVVIIIRLV